MGNILFFNYVDRVAFILEMKKYIKSVQKNSKIIVLSNNEYCPSQGYADAFILIPQKNQGVSVVEFIKNIILEKNIVGFFLQNNYDIELLLQIEDWLINNNIVYFTPDRETYNLCMSKCKMFEHLSNNHILTPYVYNYSYFKEERNCNHFQYPLILKPDVGQGSDGVHIINSSEEFEFFYKRIENPLIQQYIHGKHYTVDCFNDLAGELRVCVPRERVVVVNGGASVSRVVYDNKIKDVAYLLSSKIQITGIWNFQVINNQDSYFINDINPRLAGGMIYSILAGVPFHKYIVNTLLGININDWHYEYNNATTISLYKNYTIL